jgi:hypothetical protein
MEAREFEVRGASKASGVEGIPKVPKDKEEGWKPKRLRKKYVAVKAPFKPGPLRETETLGASKGSDPTFIPVSLLPPFCLSYTFVVFCSGDGPPEEEYQRSRVHPCPGQEERCPFEAFGNILEEAGGTSRGG